MVEIKRLNVGGETYEIVDEAARADVDKLESDVKSLQSKDKEILERIDNVIDKAIDKVANGITKTISGEVISVSDVSPINHEMNVKVNCLVGVDPTKVNVKKCGKNLAYGASTGNILSNGVTISRTNDSSELMVNGTATTTTSVIATKSIMLPAGTYTVSIYGLNTSSDNLDRAYVWDQGSEKVLVNYIMTDKPKTFTITEPRYARIEIVFGEGTNYTNKKVQLQLECGNTSTKYEECVKVTEYTPISDGTILEMTSLSPNMTILTDKEDVTIECEYIQDTNKVIEKLTNAIVALGGTL